MIPLPDRMTVIAIRKPGDPDVLIPELRSVPRSAAGEILVKVAAAGVNRPDVMQRMGLYPPPQCATDIPGLEIAGDVAAQTDRVLRNISEILEAAGSGLGKVVRSGVFLKNMNDFAAMNTVYGKYFSSAPPARSTVEVARLPKDVLVEIDVIALA